ncbi:MAG TPA: alpha-glucan family phosphorylase [Armatimonadota bacterium]|jgi:starch phosphorylase
MSLSGTVAYFSMEVGLRSDMPTYSGGLGVLAGDTLRAAADLALPMVGVTLLHRKGNFRQTIDQDGWQHESPEEWNVSEHAEELPHRVSVEVEGRTVVLRAWRYSVKGSRGAEVPVFLLDTDLPENQPDDRTFTHYLYGGDPRYRLCQEVVLGIGGVRMLQVLGYGEIACYHMNEGHAALLTLELLEQAAAATGAGAPNRDHVAQVRKRCVFTTHTPVPAGHDHFPMDLVARVLGDRPLFGELADVVRPQSDLNMTYLALNLSGYVNGVAKKHGEVSRGLFPGYAIDSITNGVHSGTWLSPELRDLFDRRIPDWRVDSFSLRGALSVPAEELWDAHRRSKERLLARVAEQTGTLLAPDRLTIGFARRAAAYKRADLLFHDLGRLRSIYREKGPFQLLFSGKAHPQDQGGKDLIHRVHELRRQLGGEIPLLYLENYNMELSGLLVAGVDLWLNNPEPPLEASGTSGMKAALNGVPSLSILDGWWIEGHQEGITGWSIGEQDGHLGQQEDRARDADSLYRKLGDVVLPTYYQRRDQYIDVMRHAIALNGSYFSTQRMVLEYVAKAYCGRRV